MSRELPRGPHSLSRKYVAENQRSRILRAMIEAVGQNGYTQTPVAAVIERAAVSRKAFYEHFPTKDVCFNDAVDALIQVTIEHVDATTATETPERDAIALVESLLADALDYPEAIRVVLAELCARGPDGVLKRSQVLALVEGLVGTFAGLPPRLSSPNPIVRATAGGVAQILYAWACGDLPMTPGIGRELLDWSRSYHPIPSTAMRQDRAPRSRPTPGGRAPGSLSPTPTMSYRLGLRGIGPASRSLVIHSQRERILDAVTNLSATEGYGVVTINSIVVQSGVSADTFYAHFTSKEDAFLVAHAIGYTRMLAITQSACEAAADWSSGVRAAIVALLDFFASEPTFARVALIDAQVVAPQTATRVRVALDTFTEMFTSAREGGQPVSPVWSEAIIGGLFELCVGYTAEGRSHELESLIVPATYFALAPVIGVQAAARAANGR